MDARTYYVALSIHTLKLFEMNTSLNRTPERNLKGGFLTTFTAQHSKALMFFFLVSRILYKVTT